MSRTPGSNNPPAVAAPPLVYQALPFADANGDLDQSAVWPTMGRPKVAVDKAYATVIGGYLESYLDITTDAETSVMHGTRGTGDPLGVTAHGGKTGIHWTTQTGDIPGTSYSFVYQYFAGKLCLSVQDAYWVQLGPLKASGYPDFSPWDPDNGDNSRDNVIDLGRYTDAGVDGEGYTRHRRWGIIYTGGGIKGGAGSIKTTTPFLKPVTGAVPGWKIRDAGDTIDGSLTCKTVAASGGLAAFGATPPASAGTVGAVTNNITSGGTNNQLDNWTNLSTYSTDAPAIRNAVYQCARMIKNIRDALNAAGLVT